MSREIAPSGSRPERERRRRLPWIVRTRLLRECDVELARIEQATVLHDGRVQAVAYVGRRAMREVAEISQMEATLSSLVPLSVGRLRAIADLTTMETASVIGQTAKRVSGHETTTQAR